MSKKEENFKIIENHLRKYKNYKVGVKTLKKQLDYIMPNVTASYELREGSNGTFNIKSDTEKFAIDRIESKKALVIHEDIERYRVIVDTIDLALSELDDIELKFVELRYFQRKPIKLMLDELGFSEKYINTVRIQVRDKLLISLKGLLHF